MATQTFPVKFINPCRLVWLVTSNASFKTTVTLKYKGANDYLFKKEYENTGNPNEKVDSGQTLKLDKNKELELTIEVKGVSDIRFVKRYDNIGVGSKGTIRGESYWIACEDYADEDYTDVTVTLYNLIKQL